MAKKAGRKDTSSAVGLQRELRRPWLVPVLAVFYFFITCLMLHGNNKGITLVLLWICRRVGASQYLGMYVKVVSVVYLAAAVIITLLAKQGKLKKLLPASADLLQVYAACGLTVVSIAAALISTAAAYYVMWALGIVVFALAVYYTVKQL